MHGSVVRDCTLICRQTLWDLLQHWSCHSLPRKSKSQDFSKLENPLSNGGVSFKSHTTFLLPSVVNLEFSHFWWPLTMDLVLSAKRPEGSASSGHACLWLKQECFSCSRISPSSKRHLTALFCGVFAMATTCCSFLALYCSGSSLMLGTALRGVWAPEKHRHPEGPGCAGLTSGSRRANIVPWQPRRPSNWTVECITHFVAHWSKKDFSPPVHGGKALVNFHLESIRLFRAPQSKKGVQGALKHPEEGSRANSGSGRHILWGESEDTGVVQFGEHKAKRQSHCSLQLSRKESRDGSAGLFTLVTDDRTCVGMAQNCTRRCSDSSDTVNRLVMKHPRTQIGVLERR